MSWDILSISGAFLITTTTVKGAIYGFTFALYILCIRSVYLQLKEQEKRKHHVFAMVYMSLSMALLLLNLVVDARGAQISYVDHAEDDSYGGYSYWNNTFSSSPAAFVYSSAVILLDLMMFGIQTWRQWIIWKGSRYSLFIVAFPVLALVTNLALEITDMILIVARLKSTPPLVLLFGYGSAVLSLFISTSVTISIIGRIVAVRMRNKTIMSQSHVADPYTSVISMLIESFSLEFVWNVVLLSTDFRTTNTAIHITALFFAQTQSFIQVLAYLLVVYRVNTGRGWTEDTAERISTLQWNRDGLESEHISTRTSILITREEA